MKGLKQLIDIDYWDKLTEKEKQWLRKFNKEFYMAYFDTVGRKNLHNKEQRTKIRREIKARLEDAYNKATPVKGEEPK